MSYWRLMRLFLTALWLDFVITFTIRPQHILTLLVGIVIMLPLALLVLAVPYEARAPMAENTERMIHARRETMKDIW